MTEAELQGIATQALNMARRDIERGGFNFLFASYHAEDVPPLHRMSKIEALVIERLGEDWLNSGGRKDIAFQLLRLAIDLLPPDAVVIVTAGNLFCATEAFDKLSAEERKKVTSKGNDGLHKAAKEGLMEVADGLLAVAQTPEMVCHCTQTFPRGKPPRQPEINFVPQSQMRGRLKMYS